MNGLRDEGFTLKRSFGPSRRWARRGRLRQPRSLPSAFFAHRGHVRHRHHDDQIMQAHRLTLVTDTCVMSTTGYLQDAIDAHRADGYEISDETIIHLSPTRFEDINPYGAYTIDVAGVLNCRSRPPLRKPHPTRG